MDRQAHSRGGSPQLGWTAALLVLAVFALGSPAPGQTWSQSAKLRAGNPGADDAFGQAVALDGDTVVVGAITANGRIDNTGAAYVLRREPGGSWSETARLFAADGEPYDWFGYSVAIDGDVAAVGSVFAVGQQWAAGAAYVFRRDVNGQWTQEARLIAPDGEQDDRFGHSIAVAGDTILVGCPQDTGRDYQSGSVYVYKRDGGGQWLMTQRLIADDGQAYDLFGTSVGYTGDWIVIGSPQDGDFGYGTGSAYVFGLAGGQSFTQLAKLLSGGAEEGDYFGTSVATSGTSIIIGAPSDDDRGSNAGAAYVFAYSGGAWSEQAKLLADDGSAIDQFGIAVAIDDRTALVGAYWNGDLGSNSGSAYAFINDGGIWSQQQKLLADDGSTGDWFGQSVGVSGDRALVGSPNDDDGGDGSGSAYIYERSSAGPMITVAGSCPGPMQLTVSGATPHGLVALVAGFRAGSFTLPPGPCQGLVVDIRPPYAPGAPLVTRADAQGRVAFSRPLPAQACGISVQAIDGSTCSASNRVVLD
ncbi:MAG: FG-GAP repeat protein [Phycisphaerales bacterium]|nr:FG-GAP repeat protein [Phycisphaerales bacterium]